MGEGERGESGSQLRIIDVVLLIVWRSMVSRAHRSITATISLEQVVCSCLGLSECVFFCIINTLFFNCCTRVIFMKWKKPTISLQRTLISLFASSQDTGKLNVSYFRFDINDATGDLDANRPVPFRLTPNISEFLTTIGVSGPLTASMIAVARCFAQPNFKVTPLNIFNNLDEWRLAAKDWREKRANSS